MTNWSRLRGYLSPGQISRIVALRLGIGASAITLAVLVPVWLGTMQNSGAPRSGAGASPSGQVGVIGSQPGSPSGDAGASLSPSLQPSTADDASGSPAASGEVEGAEATPGASVTAPTSKPSGTASTPRPATPKPTEPPAPVSGTIFVATSGSDTNPGSASRPFKTIAHAASVAGSGSTVLIRGGSYGGFDVRRSGISFAAYPGESVTVSDATREDVITFRGVTSGALSGLVVSGSTTAYGSGIKIDESSGVTVRGSVIRDNRTFGIVVVRSSNVRIEGNEVTGNADGIEERYASGLVIVGNKIHGNTKMVDSGRGKEGINFYKSTGPITVTGNLLWDNGTHFEVYGASNLNITGNVTWNGQIMETGTDGPACDGNRFTRNIGYKGSGYQGGETNGMILRCASNMLVAHNTLDGFDLFAFDIVDGTQGVAYGGSIAGLRITNNIAVGGRAFSIDSTLPGSVKIDRNLLYNVGSTARYGNHLAYVKYLDRQFDSLDVFAAATGYEQNGVFGEPRFVNGSGRDYHLRSDSPAVDRGTVVLSDGFAGAAPDLGRYEGH